MWCENVGTSLFRFVTVHAFDKQTDGRTDGQKGFGNTVHCITYIRTVIFTDALEVNSVTHFVIYIVHTGWLLNSSSFHHHHFIRSVAVADNRTIQKKTR